MNQPPNDQALDVLFRQARTHRAWLEQPVSDDILRQLYDLMKLGPTSSNCSPARILFVRSQEAKQRLAPALSPGNVEKTMKAPVTAIIGYDLQFYEFMPKLSPNNPKMRDTFANLPDVDVHAFRNGTLQGAYLILAARSLGLDCGPMSGFDNKKVDDEFFSGGERIKSNFLCNLGYGDASKLQPRNPRLDFDEACQLL